MKFKFVSKKCTAREETKQYTEKKLGKLEKFFSGDCTMNVVYTLVRENLFSVEATANYGGLIFRAQATSNTDFKPCIDEITDVLIRQIRKHKTKLEKKIKDVNISFDVAADEPEDEYNIVRNKTVTVKPMTDEEAILQMNMLDHDFFIYKSDDGVMKVMYRRKDGNYGVLETE